MLKMLLNADNQRVKMTSGQKIAFSLLTAMGLFAAFVLSLHSTLFKQLEMKFYTQAKIEDNTGQLNKLAENYDLYIQEILTQLETGENAWCRTSAVRSYYLQNPSESDVNQRRQENETLFSKISSLNGIRILDKNGRNVHFSTYDNTDILKQTGITKVYKNYPDIMKDVDEISFELLAKTFDEKHSRILLDEERNRIIISVPYFWMDQVYSGQCLFYFNLFDIEKELTARDVLALGQNFVMYSSTEDFKGGFAVGIPAGKKKEFKAPVEKYWKTRTADASKLQTPEKLLEMEDGRFYVALSSTTSDLNITGIYTSDIFELSSEIKMLIYIAVFISILLIVFLLFSITRDPEQVLKKRIKKIQYGIIKDCIDKEEKVEWAYISRQLKSRKKDLTSEILKSLKVHSKKKRKELNEFLENNWNEIFSIFDDKAEAAAVVPQSNSLNGDSLAAIRQMLEEVLQTTKLNVAPVVKTVKVAAEPVEEIEEVEELDDVEEIEDAEEVVDDVEEIEDAEEVLDDVDEIEDAEEVVDDVEEIEDAEEIEELDEVDEDELEVLEEEVPYTFHPEILLENQPVYVYKPGPETYFRSEEFATVENYNAEELVLGPSVILKKGEPTGSELLDFQPYSLIDEETEVEEVEAVESEEPEEPETVEELEEFEELPEAEENNTLPYYSMTAFAENLTGEMPVLEGISSDKDAIVEKNGVFSIAESLEYGNVQQNQEFKALVDSVL